MSEPGHNSGITAGQLNQYIQRVERLETEKATIAEDIKEVFKEAHGNGFDVKAMKAIIKERKTDAAALAEHNAIVELYRDSLGQLDGTPLAEAALASATA